MVEPRQLSGGYRVSALGQVDDPGLVRGRGGKAFDDRRTVARQGMVDGGWGLGECNPHLPSPIPHPQRMAPAEIAQQPHRKGWLVEGSMPRVVVRHSGCASEQVLEAALPVAQRLG